MSGVGLAVAAGTLVWYTERPHLAQGGNDQGAVVQLSVPAGGRPVTYPLPDGSRVTLAPGSAIVSRGAFGDSARALELRGEALFEVSDANAPFTVYAAGVEVRDASAAFVVRAMPAVGGSAPTALVAVTDGEVQVSAGSWHSALHEGEATTADSTGHHAALGVDVMRGSVAWTSGALLFDDEEVVNALERLQRWTGVSIVADPSLRGRRLSVRLEGEDPEQAVHLVADALGARATKWGAGWVLSP